MLNEVELGRLQTQRKVAQAFNKITLAVSCFIAGTFIVFEAERL